MWQMRRGKYWRLTRRVLAQRDADAHLSDEELKAKTVELRAKLAAGASVRSLLVPAYALVCVASQRVLGKLPYTEQVYGAVLIEYQHIIEMKTGEGKTLTALMPMFLHGLTGPGNFLITANPYLARRDAAEMGQVYEWLGLTVAAADTEGDDDHNDRSERAAIYAADIVYTTQGALGFDYLFDNLADDKNEQVLQGLNFALIDEADAVLLDSAQTPLIVSGAPRVQSNLYRTCDRVVKLLDFDRDVEMSDDQRKVWFTDAGIERLMRDFGVANLMAAENRSLYRHLLLAAQANFRMVRQRDYLVVGDDIILVDRATGRQLPGVKLQSGLQQAIEAKEGLKLSEDTRALGEVTYQHLFRMFHQLSGMTGTAATDTAELIEVYRLAVAPVPTHKPNQRRDHPDKLFITSEAKQQAVIKAVKAAYGKQRPVLLETGSVAASLAYSAALVEAKIPHTVLNAESTGREAAIIAVAGQPGAVTVSTAMAGRGTDIRLGSGVASQGGLLVLGSELTDNRRVADQLRGRAGRQGDPGETQFFAALDDEVVVEDGGAALQQYYIRHRDSAHQVIHLPRIRRGVFAAQQRREAHGRDDRFQTLTYGEVYRLQRDCVYDARQRLLEQAPTADELDKLLSAAAAIAVRGWQNAERSAPYDYVVSRIDANYTPATNQEIGVSELIDLMRQRLASQRQQLKSDSQWHAFTRSAVIKAIDASWIDQVDKLQTLQILTSNQRYGGQQPLLAYQDEAQAAFSEMRATMLDRAVRNLLQADYEWRGEGRLRIIFP